MFVCKLTCTDQPPAFRGHLVSPFTGHLRQVFECTYKLQQSDKSNFG